MINPIAGNVTPAVSPIQREIKPAQIDKQTQGKSFGQAVNDAVQQLNLMQEQADKAAYQVASGQGGNIHDALVTMEEASLALQLALQVRNKTVEGLQEVMRMQV